MSDTHAYPNGAHDADNAAPAEAHHASAKTYYIVGFILTAITALEVGIFYIHLSQALLIPVLLFLSLIKFVTVVQFFMHLRYDSKILSRVFFGPLSLAILVVVGMILLFKWIPRFYW
jgi:cytochrome c oxidase subunit 4